MEGRSTAPRSILTVNGSAIPARRIVTLTSVPNSPRKVSRTLSELQPSVLCPSMAMLDGRADAVVLAALLHPHIIEGFAVIIIGMRIENAEHALNGGCGQRFI